MDTALVVALIVRSAYRALPVVPAAALAALALLPLLERAARKRHREIGPVVAAAGLAAQAPLLLLLSLWGLGVPAWLAAWLDRSAPLALLGGWLLGALAAALTARLGRAPRAARLQALGWGVVACGIAVSCLIALAGIRAARAPSLAAHLEALPEVARFQTFTARSDAPRQVEDGLQREEALQGARPGATLYARLHCLGFGCGLWLASTPGAVARVVPIERGQAIRVLHDAGSRLWVVALPRGMQAYQEGSLEPVPLRAAEIRAALSAPLPTIGAAAVGVLLSILGLARLRRHLGRAAAFSAMLQGTLGADGWIQFDDGSPDLRAETDRAIEPGRVIAPSGAGELDGGAAYREAPVLSASIIAGCKEELVMDALSDASAALARSAAAVVLAAAPLCAALIAGIAV